MNDPKPTDFRPKWYESASPERRAELEAEPWIGSQPYVFPRVTTRILPLGGSATLSARALSEIIENTQKLATYAAYDVVNGVNPEFSDLRSVGPQLQKFSLLTVEPFEEGSFVIPARFEAAPLEAQGEDMQTATTDQVALRFQEILKSLSDRLPATSVSLGALQTVDALTHTMEKIGADVEFSAADSLAHELPPVRADSTYRGQIREVLKRRRPTSQALETLEGHVTALDIVQGSLMLSVEGAGDRIKCTFPTTLHPKLLESLGCLVRLYGLIERKRGRPFRMNIHDSESLDD